jgi:ATP-dependent Clp protease ATP-binding subunit ClpC
MRRGFFRRWWQSDWLPQTPRAKKVVEFAMEEAQARGDNYVGTEHLLLGLIREREGVAAQLLTRHGVGLDGVRRELARQHQEGIREV